MHLHQHPLQAKYSASSMRNVPQQHSRSSLLLLRASGLHAVATGCCCRGRVPAACTCSWWVAVAVCACGPHLAPTTPFASGMHLQREGCARASQYACSAPTTTPLQVPRGEGMYVCMCKAHAFATVVLSINPCSWGMHLHKPMSMHVSARQCMCKCDASAQDGRGGGLQICVQPARTPDRKHKINSNAGPMP